jgi:hypothetical protein
MLDAIVAGQADPERLADLALGHLRAKIPELQLALAGTVREHHRFLLKRLLQQLRFVENEIDVLRPASGTHWTAGARPGGFLMEGPDTFLIK